MSERGVVDSGRQVVGRWVAGEWRALVRVAGGKWFVVCALWQLLHLCATEPVIFVGCKWKALV